MRAYSAFSSRLRAPKRSAWKQKYKKGWMEAWTQKGTSLCFLFVPRRKAALPCIFPISDGCCTRRSRGQGLSSSKRRECVSLHMWGGGGGWGGQPPHWTRLKGFVLLRGGGTAKRRLPGLVPPFCVIVGSELAQPAPKPPWGSLLVCTTEAREMPHFMFPRCPFTSLPLIAIELLFGVDSHGWFTTSNQ